MAHPNELDALYAFLVAAAVTALLTPVTMRLARAVGAIDQPRERGLSERPTPLLGGLAIFAGALVAGLIWLPAGYYKRTISCGTACCSPPRVITRGGRARRPLRAAAGGQARRPGAGGGDRRALRRGGEGDHAAVRRPAVVPQRRRDERRAAAHGDRPGGDDERGQLLRRRRRPGGGRVRDHRRRDGRDRVRPGPPAAGRARGAHGRGGARLPDLQLPAGVELHGRLRREPARAC